VPRTTAEILIPMEGDLKSWREKQSLRAHRGCTSGKCKFCEKTFVEKGEEFFLKGKRNYGPGRRSRLDRDQGDRGGILGQKPKGCLQNQTMERTPIRETPKWKKFFPLKGTESFSKANVARGVGGG